ncbi:TPA: hypothetical protein EYP70_01875 [Candidatus Bathyarchaeota archaeon]|nr:hypothetical protein [Candidatus Bathyarchaeota archaeon]
MECQSLATSKVKFDVKEIVDALNFARRTIEDGEITMILWRSPRPSMSEEEARKKVENEKKRWEEIYKNSAGELKKFAKKAIQPQSLNDLFEYFAKGFPKIEERYITFKVTKEASDEELDDAFCTKIHIMDRGKPFWYAESLYIKSVIVNQESMAYIPVGPRMNPGFVGKAVSVEVDIPYHLVGRLMHKVETNQVKKVARERLDSSEVLLVELAFRVRKVIPLVEKIWVDPQKGFSVVRCEIYYAKALVETTFCKDFKEYSGGLWYPSYVEKVKYSPFSRKAKDRCSYSIKEADFNIGVSEQFFDFSREDFIRLGIPLTRWYGQPVYGQK